VQQRLRIDDDAMGEECFVYLLRYTFSEEHGGDGPEGDAIVNDIHHFSNGNVFARWRSWVVAGGKGGAVKEYLPLSKQTVEEICASSAGFAMVLNEKIKKYCSRRSSPRVSCKD
jgi:hypothetical protein